jgi:hypothetical protein
MLALADFKSHPGEKMPTALKALTPEAREALGKTSGLAPRYDALLVKSKSESLRDEQDASKYVDDIVKRYRTINATSPSTEKLQQTKDAYLAQLKQHGAEVGVMSFSKPGDVASRLQELDIEPDTIAKITKGMEQAGGDDEIGAILLSSLITSETSLGLCSGGHHHHGHGW